MFSILVCAALTVPAGAGDGWQPPTAGNEAMRPVLAHVVADLPELDPLKPPRQATYAEQRYAEFYGLNPPGCRHDLGALQCGRWRIAAQLFRPHSSHGTVILVHGYYDHAGVLHHLIADLVERGYNVVVYDQPGHGLSDGARADIDSFAGYVTVFRHVVQLCRGAWDLPGPYHVVAHSLGAAVVTDYLAFERSASGLAKVVFVAPLVRSAHWRLSGVSSAVAGRFAGSVRRVFRNNSRDAAFRRFLKDDPLQPRTVPFAWVRAHRAWVKRIAQATPDTARSIDILQGEADNVVAATYNVAFLTTLFPKAHVTVFEKGGHQLLNEEEPLRGEVLERLAKVLESATPSD